MSISSSTTANSSTGNELGLPANTSVVLYDIDQKGNNAHLLQCTKSECRVDAKKVNTSSSSVHSSYCETTNEKEVTSIKNNDSGGIYRSTTSMRHFRRSNDSSKNQFRPIIMERRKKEKDGTKGTETVTTTRRSSERKKTSTKHSSNAMTINIIEKRQDQSLSPPPVYSNSVSASVLLPSPQSTILHTQSAFTGTIINNDGVGKDGLQYQEGGQQKRQQQQQQEEVTPQRRSNHNHDHYHKKALRTLRHENEGMKKECEELESMIVSLRTQSNLIQGRTIMKVQDYQTSIDQSIEEQDKLQTNCRRMEQQILKLRNDITERQYQISIRDHYELEQEKIRKKAKEKTKRKQLVLQQQRQQQQHQQQQQEKKQQQQQQQQQNHDTNYSRSHHYHRRPPPQLYQHKKNDHFAGEKQYDEVRPNRFKCRSTTNLRNNNNNHRSSSTCYYDATSGERNNTNSIIARKQQQSQY